MKLFAGGAFLAVAAGSVYMFGGQRPADVYAMPVPDVYRALSTVQFGEMSEGAKVLHTKNVIGGNGHDKVTWLQHGDMAAFKCDMDLAPLPNDPQQTKITVTCDGSGAGDGAAAGMVHNMHRNAVIERIDATLDQRAYSKEKALGSTASRWPGDGVDGSLVHAQGEALKMAADMSRDIARMEREERASKADRAHAEWSAGTPDRSSGNSYGSGSNAGSSEDNQ